MNERQINRKLERLQEIIAEAKEIIFSLEELCKENDVLSRIPVTDLNICAGSGYRTRFLNICSSADIKTIRELKEYGFLKFKQRPNCGYMTADLVRRALAKQYKIKW